MKDSRQRRLSALWRLERDLAREQKKVASQDGGASDFQKQDMVRMERDIAILKQRAGSS